jgi:phosphoglycolate phosphatase-like HAD superfamily hydrolase
MADDVDFLKSFENDSGVTNLKILGHTGRSIVVPIERFAAHRKAVGIDQRLDIQILLRDKGAESPRRRNQIISTEEHLKNLGQKYPWLRIQVRYYSALQTLRGHILKRVDGSKRALFSAYEWTLQPRHLLGEDRLQPIRTTAVEWSRELQAANNDDLGLLGILENWFDYYWGPGLLHTIAFDFDDTIVDTYEDKINAWIFGIEQMLKEYGPEHLHPDFRRDFEGTPANRFNLLKDIVDRIPLAPEIITNIVSNAPAHVTSFLDGQRSSYRTTALFPPRMTEKELKAHVESKVFPGVREVFQEIRERGYSIAVASLTDEQRIESALKLTAIPHVGIIVGKNEYQDRELKEQIKNAKIFLIRKIANLSGVPVSRILYVGDHEKDEDAAREVGASFIHAGLIPSLKESSDARVLSFDHYTNLLHVIELAESRARASEKIPHIDRRY